MDRRTQPPGPAAPSSSPGVEANGTGRIVAFVLLAYTISGPSSLGSRGHGDHRGKGGAR